MLFNSVIFLFVFLPVTYLVFWNLKSKTSRYQWLTLTGYVFYGWWNWRFCFLMLFSTLVSYFAGLAILKADDAGVNKSRERFKKKLYMWLAIAVDLSLLGFFKYYNFFAENINAGLPHLNIILPVGISFYTFHTMSYMIDAYRGTIKPTRNFFEFSCYVSLFSQLVAGPIVRFRQIEADLENIDHSKRTAWVEEGVVFLITGLAKKVLIADTIAAFIDPGYKQVATMGTLGSWMLALGYTYQLYFDFSGYSDMAIGLGYLFGIRIPQNFNSPYKAINISDFWRRWHMSLSTWLRDYLYIPLGGNRHGSIRTRMNLMMTMLLGGLWHGANWTFVVWGAYHGLLLTIQHLWSQFVGRHARWSISDGYAQCLTFLSVVLGWVYFRAEKVQDAHAMFRKLFVWTGGETPDQPISLFAFLILAAVVAHLFPNSNEMKFRVGWIRAVGFVILFLVCVAKILSNDNTPFLYFQF